MPRLRPFITIDLATAGRLLRIGGVVTRRLGARRAGFRIATARAPSVSWLRCTRGATAIEFAIVFMPLALLLLGGLQISLLFEVQAVLQSAAEKAAREILIGTPQTQNYTQAQFKSDVCAGLPVLLNCNKLLVDVQVITPPTYAPAPAPVPVYDSSGTVTNSGAYTLGGSGDVVALRLLYVWPVVVLPGMNLANLGQDMRLLVATSVVKTEAF